MCNEFGVVADQAAHVNRVLDLPAVVVTLPLGGTVGFAERIPEVNIAARAPLISAQRLLDQVIANARGAENLGQPRVTGLLVRMNSVFDDMVGKPFDRGILVFEQTGVDDAG